MDIFNLPNARTCSCAIRGYTKSHLFMEIAVKCINNDMRESIFYIQLNGVEYFEGPTIWQGAYFQQMPHADCLDLLNKLKRYKGVPEEYLLERFQLIATTPIDVEENSLIVKILVANSSISTLPSPHFLTYFG